LRCPAIWNPSTSTWNLFSTPKLCPERLESLESAAADAITVLVKAPLAAYFFPARIFAHLAFCAAAILRLPAAEIVRFGFGARPFAFAKGASSTPSRLETALKKLPSAMPE
jgi:hypothetical protein